jgi:hypothetical protein
MTVKTKIKTQSKTKSLVKKPRAVSRKSKAKHFHVSYLALTIAGLLILEGILFSTASAADWKAGVSVLNLSKPLQQTSRTFMTTISPMVETVQGINSFYDQATTAATSLLDLSAQDTTFADIFVTVKGFYEQASIELAQLVGLPDQPYYMGHVSGASIER